MYLEFESQPIHITMHCSYQLNYDHEDQTYLCFIWDGC